MVPFLGCKKAPNFLFYMPFAAIDRKQKTQTFPPLRLKTNSPISSTYALSRASLHGLGL